MILGGALLTFEKSVFQEKDYLNYRYFHKRAYYLACLAAGIKDSSSCNFHVKFDCLNGNPLQPVLNLTPKSGKS